MRVEHDFGVSGLAGDTAFPPGEGPPLPPVPLGRDGPRGGEGPQRARLALVAGAATRSPRARTARSTRACSARPACGAAPTAPRRRSTAPTGRRPSSAASSSITGARVRAAHDAAPTAWSSGAVYMDAGGDEHDVKAPRDDPVRQRDRHAAAAAAVGRPLPGGLANSLRAGRQAADDAPVRHRRGPVRGRPRIHAGRRGASTCTRSSSTRPTPTRGFVRGAKWGLQPTGGPMSMTRAYPWGAENADLGRRLPRRRAQAPGPLGDVGDHRRGPAGGAQPRRCSTRATRTAGHAGGEDRLPDVPELLRPHALPRRRARRSRSRRPARTRP